VTIYGWITLGLVCLDQQGKTHNRVVIRMIVGLKGGACQNHYSYCVHQSSRSERMCRALTML